MVPIHGTHLIQDLPQSRIFFVGLALSMVRALLVDFFQDITLPDNPLPYTREHLALDLDRLPESFTDQGYVLVAQDVASYLVLSRDGERFFLATVPYEGVDGRVALPHEGGLSLPEVRYSSAA